MFLSSLAELAEREGWVESPGFSRDYVDFEIAIDQSGRFMQLISLEQDNGKGQIRLVPTIVHTNKVDPGILYDNAKYVLGLETKRTDRTIRCRDSFAGLIRALPSSDLRISAVQSFYDAFDQNLKLLLQQRDLAEWTGAEKLVFLLVGVGYCHDADCVSRIVKSDPKPHVSGARCLVSGQVSDALRVHPKVKRVPGASMPSPLVSFNEPAFCSHRLQQGENAHISANAAERFTLALNKLLEKPEGSKQPHRYGVKVSPDTVVVYWATAPLTDLDDFAKMFETTTPEAVETLIKSAWSGSMAKATDVERFYAVALGGNVTRIVIRDWYETSLRSLEQNIRNYFEDLCIGNRIGDLSIYNLRKALAPPGDNASAPSDLTQKMFMSSISGRPLPIELLRHALQRLRSDKKDAERRLQARCSLIKAVLCSRRRSGQSKLKEIFMSLDDSNNSASYVLGRLFAALERAQSNALGDTNASIRDRYFGAASSAPITVFPRLLRMAQHHISKAKAENHDYGIERIIANIVCKLPAKPFPSVMNLEEQGLFAIGYYHQREAFYVKKAV
jgi:CRISPR-associated protein Csd1